MYTHKLLINYKNVLAFLYKLYYNKYKNKSDSNITQGGVVMNISSISIPMSMASVSNDIEIAMLSKSLDTLETTGDGIQKMLEASVTPHLGQNIDYSV